jgi:hypothetical protein
MWSFDDEGDDVGMKGKEIEEMKTRAKWEVKWRKRAHA